MPCVLAIRWIGQQLLPITLMAMLLQSLALLLLSRDMFLPF